MKVYCIAEMCETGKVASGNCLYTGDWVGIFVKEKVYFVLVVNCTTVTGMIGRDHLTN